MCSQRALVSVDGEAQRVHTKSRKLDTGMLYSHRIHKEKWTWLSQLQPFVLKCPSCVVRSINRSQIGGTKVSFVFADRNDFSRHEFVRVHLKHTEIC